MGLSDAEVRSCWRRAAFSVNALQDVTRFDAGDIRGTSVEHIQEHPFAFPIDTHISKAGVYRVLRKQFFGKLVYRGHPSNGQAKLAFLNLGQVTLELIQPVGNDTAWKEFLDTNGEGVHHIAFQIADPDKTIKEFQDVGMPVQHQGRFDDDSGSYVYIDSAKALGVTLELLHPDAKK